MRFLLVSPLVVVSIFALGCESADYSECVHTDDPTASPGTRTNRCAPSQFPITAATQWRDVSGQVRRGENGVSAIVHVEPSSEYAGEKAGGITATVAADPLGFFGPIRGVSLRYNITFREGADLISYQNMAGRFVQPNFEPLPNAPRFARATTATLAVTIDPPLAADQTVTFFTSGDKAFDVFGSYETGLSIVGSEFTYPTTIHALLHKKDGDLTTSTEYARADVTVVAGSILPLSLRFEKITNENESIPTLDPNSSPDYVPGQVEVLVGYSRTSFRKVGVVDLNVKKKFPAFPNHLYVFYRAHLVGSDGTVSDSGEKGFNIFGPESFILMPPAPKILSPAPTETIFKTGTELIATGALGGLYEHVFEPKSGRPGTIRIATRSVVTTVPDLQKLGASNLDGDFIWTVRAYDEIQIPEFFGGIDGRRYWRFSSAPPRTVRFAASEN